MWFNYSVIVDENMLPDNPLYWSRLTPVNCSTVRIVGIFLCITAFIGIVLNGAIIYSFIRYKALRTSPNMYVIFIAIMGLLASCTILPSTGISSVYCKWLYKRVGCQLSAVIAFLYGCSSSYLLCVVSVSRCYIVIRPFSANNVTVKKSTIISCLAVLLAFIWSMLPIIGWNEYVMEGARTSCCINWYDRRFRYISFTFFLFIFVYCIPLMILIVSNTITLVGLKRMREKIERGIHTVLNRKRIAMERRIVKSIVITTCGFIFTWTPYAITLFVSAFRGKDYAIEPLVTFFCACFAKSSVIWIPMLHIGTSTQFQLSLVNVNVNTTTCQSESNQIDGPVSTPLIIIRNSDGSIVVRAADQNSDNTIRASVNTNICHA